METVIARVEKMAPEGEALARQEGGTRVIFIPYGAPGDRLEVELSAAKSTFARGRIKRMLEPGPERVEPPCPLHFAPGRLGPACGGCDWQQLGYEAQLKHKREIVADCLKRIAKIPDADVAQTLASPQQWAYRNKVQIPFAPAGPGRPPLAGYYEAGSHRIVDLDACPVQPELSMRIIRKVKELSAPLGILPPFLRHLFVRTNAAGQALAALVTRGDRLPRGKELVAALRESFPELVAVFQNVQPLDTSVILGPRWIKLWGADGLTEKVGRFQFFSSPGAFLQVNTPASEVLYDHAAKALGGRFATILDVYCGVGTLSIWIAGHAGRVIGIEENVQAVRDAWANAKANRTANVRFLAGRAETVVPRLAGQGLKEPCAVVVDPPRAGLAPGLTRLLARPAFQRLVYVSCNPATFARDAGFLVKQGYRLEKVQPIDLFPQTSHVELVAGFEKR